MTAPCVPLDLYAYAGCWADRFIHSFAGTIAGAECNGVIVSGF